MRTRAEDYATVFRAAAKGSHIEPNGMYSVSDMARAELTSNVLGAVAGVFEEIAKAEALGAERSAEPSGPEHLRAITRGNLL